MIIFPAIDLREGRVVRLFQGDFHQETVYSEDPVEQARLFKSLGFEFLHIVDLDGAIVGAPFNKYVIEDIVREVNIPVQVGGGIRKMEHVEKWLQSNVRRVVLGTSAVKDPDFVRQACKEFPDNIVVSLDTRDNKIATEGWLKTSDHVFTEYAKQFEDAGVVSLLYTDIKRDGTGQGPNIENIKQLASNISVPVIASGGVGNHDHLRDLKDIESVGLEGVIIGHALYEKKIDPKQAIEIVK